MNLKEPDYVAQASNFDLILSVLESQGVTCSKCVMNSVCNVENGFNWGLE